MVPTVINGRWELLLPVHRAERPEWVTGWETERLADMHNHLDPGDVIYDVGAEQGDLPGLWASWGCQVVLIEPNPIAWPNIRAVWEANGFLPPLAWWVGFASDQDATPTMPDEFNPGGDHFGRGLPWPSCSEGDAIGATGFRHLSQESDVTPQITIDSLAREVGVPDAITIDVEGSELSVLRGAASVLLMRHPIVWVSIHTDDIWMDEQYEGVRADDVHEFMAQFGYEPTVLALDHELHVRYS